MSGGFGCAPCSCYIMCSVCTCCSSPHGAVPGCRSDPHFLAPKGVPGAQGTTSLTSCGWKGRMTRMGSGW
ncbi:hypothetical protein GDO81_006218 [Engystomops pustulosus]|uniref:Secreted protein n=1 Tax=Engystomops pustulosus TaxID=76066 RepID=A0AAV7CWT2_ENGPU|nr:hypothetical protein GDO81_006218 [Engystomops pustulosus]